MEHVRKKLAQRARVELLNYHQHNSTPVYLRDSLLMIVHLLTESNKSAKYQKEGPTLSLGKSGELTLNVDSLGEGPTHPCDPS